ncbi:Short-chain dehydrogenase [Microlunatus sagamiharensis]|uniref:Short-chain dehydrogenase n=1 Tax=Microlunatus sagamiharensis TaxID=546874 RepID=A0A1H2N7E6_9ACTN|nr:SDR family NAD(P)-dependent oxidoreductase [Microlunatus sagamiharensis]SDV01071.1 Short-chain dehydrogenase [Microlunatus sagamiharensis]
MEIKNSVILVTGASAGIGEATARAASAHGARVVLAARRAERVERLARDLGDAVAVACDVTDADQVAALVARAVERFGRVDALVNNAGQGLHARVEDTAPDDLRALLELNLVAPMVLMQSVLPVMRAQGSGRIVNVSSGTTLADAPATGAYVASKIALERLSAIARAELEGSGVTVSTVVPFATRTEFITALRGGAEAAASEMAGVDFDPPERVAAMILDVIRTGAARADLVPVAYGGTRR